MKIPFPDNIEIKEDLDHSVVIRRTDGIIELRCSDIVIYTSIKIKENHDCIRRLAGGKKALVLTVAGDFTHVLPEARAYTAKGHHRDFVAAEAFLINSFMQWILAFLFLKINRPIVPAQAFRIGNKAKAERWLKRYA